MAADRAVEFNQQLEEHRSNLTANQLKRARKKRAKLFQQALTASLADGCQPAAKRTKFSDDEWPEPSMSSQLQDGSTCKQQQQQQQDDSLCHTAEGRLAEHEAEPGSTLSGAATQQAAAAAAGSHVEQQQQQQQGKKRRSKHRKPPLAGLKLLQPRSGSSQQVDFRAGGSARHAADMSDVWKALQHQALSQQQQQQQQQEQSLGDCAASAPAPLYMGNTQQPAAAAAAAEAAPAAAAAAAAGVAAISSHPAACSSASIGPCRTDLSGELAVIKQELSSNGSVDHASCNSSMMHLAMPGPSSSYDAGSSHSRGMEQLLQQQEDSAAVQQQQQRKKQRPSFQYGNYHHYYGYRIGPSGFEDARLKVLDASWFRGADVLDVGCNEGLLSLALAVGCCCRSMTGVDIDPALVAKACTNLSRTRSELTQQMRAAVAARDAYASSRRLALPPPQAAQPAAAAPDGPLSIVAASSAALLGNSSTAAGRQQPQQLEQQQQQQQHAQPEQQQEQAQLDAQQQQHPPQQQQQQWQDQRDQFRQLTARVQRLSAQIKALTRVGFKAGNWLEQGCASNKYEVVTCFSVSKWVHLNWGDDGLMRLFHKFYRCLAPGGLLVLEPQPWKSYQAAVHKQGGTSAPFYKPEQLKLRPEGFVGFLTQRVGFKLVQQLSAVSQAAGPGAVPVKGFDRPILVLRKPAALAN
uniref:RNA methyltransferase n=1 Tax=Tetradesmus obliquus TaxID=3088 RepID=A0A383VRI8_TETOB|eukprot:jgi/Sobl393_1/11568/SZX66986.1